MLEMPWLQHLDATESFAKAATAAASRTAAMTAANDALEVDIDDDLVFAGLAAVEKGRCAEAAVAVDRGHSDFRVKENYGESNVRKGKALHDAVQCYCYTKEGEEWARDLPTQVTFKMTFTEHTEPACRIVARAWVHRMQYFLTTSGRTVARALSSPKQWWILTVSQTSSHVWQLLALRAQPSSGSLWSARCHSRSSPALEPECISQWVKQRQ